MYSYDWVMTGAWLVFIGYWAISAIGVKRDIRGGGLAAVWSRFFILRLALAAFVVFVLARIASGTAHYSNSVWIFSHTLFIPPTALGWVAAFLAVVGVLFAIWARVHLGKNWSPAPAVKENHELVTSGPYQWVRHPIYTGLILAAFGSALTGTAFGACVLVIAVTIFLLRIKKEEVIMLELFPGAYPAYQARTKRLIPFVW